jgi:hypothetical protein
MPTRSLRATWRAPAVAALLFFALATTAFAGRPSGLRYPSAGKAVLNSTPAVAWSPGELGVCACTLATVATPTAQAGLPLEFFRGSFGGIPDYTQLSPVSRTIASDISVASFASDDLFALRYTGRITIPTAGSWTFTVTADDAARIILNGSTIINLDGIRGSSATASSASINLTAAAHTLDVQYVRNGIAGELALSWQGPGMPAPVRVPSTAYSHVPPLSAACAAAQGQASCTVDATCGAGFFCTADANDPTRRNGICQPVAQTPLCVDSTTCGENTVCASPVAEGGTTLTEAAFTCPPDAAGCDIDGGTPNAEVQGVAIEYYRGLFTALPDFDQLLPLEETYAQKFGLANRASEDGFALRQRAFVNVPLSGTWEFFVTSDDGSKLFVDGDLVVSNDFVHGAIEAQGSKYLTAGRHELELQYFERFGAASLRADWRLRADDGTVLRAREEIPTSVLSFVAPNRVACITSGLSCAPLLPAAMPRGVDHFVEISQISTIRGVTLRQRVQRERFQVANRLDYTVEVSRNRNFDPASILFTSPAMRKPPTSSTIRLPFTEPTSATVLERREAEAAQIVGDCGALNIDGVIFRYLCSNNGAVTMTFNAPTAGTYRFRTRVTGDQTFGGSIPPASAINDPVLVQFRVDSSIVPGEPDDATIPIERRGKRAVTSNRQTVVPATGTRQVEIVNLDFQVTPGTHTVTMAFINDLCCTPSDRNLLVDFIEISGPAETQSVLTALSQGPVYWRVNARDGTSKTTRTTDTNLLQMPDTTPPATPVVVYPEEVTDVLSTRPAVTWNAVQEAASYEVTFTNTVTGTVRKVTSTTNSIPGPGVDFERGDAYIVEVRALDAIGNASPPSTARRIRIASRVEYRFQASRTPSFTATSLLYEAERGLARSFGPLNVPAQPSFSQRISSVGPQSSGSDCGVTGDGYQLLCGGGQFRDHTVNIPSDGTYSLSIDAYQTMGGPDDTRMEVSVDGNVVETLVVPNLRANPRTYRLSTAMAAGFHAIRVRFVNDYCCTNTGRTGETGDRNLFVRSVSVDGPANVPTLADMFALGPLYWRVIAVDGNSRSTAAAPTFLVEFPDRTPPAPPIVLYPEDAAETAAASPVFAWNADPDAREYEFVINDGVNDVVTRRGAATIVNDVADLVRGTGYQWSVTAIDAQGNRSTPVSRSLRIGPRIVYKFSASTLPVFTPQSLIFSREDIADARPRVRLETAGLSSEAISELREVENLEGSGCGIRDRFVTTNSSGVLQTIADGNKYQVLCTNAESRVMRFQAPLSGLYRVKIAASADQVGGQQPAIMAVTGAGGRTVQVPIVRPRLSVDNQTAAFSPNQIVTGAKSGARATVLSSTALNGIGTLDLTSIVGTFINDEQITGAVDGVAVVNGALSYPLAGSPVNYNPVLSLNNANPGREEYVLEMAFDKGPQSVTVEYINDFCCSPGDKNLLVDNITVEGPLNDRTIIAALSRGPVFWTAVAADRTERTNQPDNVFVVEFPDLVPPSTPVVRYPDVSAAILDQYPTFVWDRVDDAVEYQVVLQNLGTSETVTQTTTDTSFQWPSSFPRGTTLSVTVIARDESNNLSLPSSPVPFSIGNRLSYTLQASLSPSFAPDFLLYEERNLASTKVGPLDTLFVDPPVSITKTPFDVDTSGNNCGAAVAGGQTFINLCGQNHYRDFPFRMTGETAEYIINVNAFGVVVNNQASRVRIALDGLSLGEFDVPQTSASPRVISLPVNISNGPHLITTTFLNDFCCSPADRNLFIGNVSVVGPVGNETVFSRLSEGNVYWRVTAFDGLNRGRNSTSYVIVFPDNKPPLPAIPVYPEVGAVILSTKPAITFTGPSDATKYLLRVVEAGGNATLVREIPSPGAGTISYLWDATPLTRGRAYNWTVQSIDAAGNVSAPSSLQPFSVDSRVRYQVTAATRPPDANGAFPETSIVSRVENLTTNRLPLSTTVAVPVNITAEMEESSSFGTSCGVSAGSGRNWVNICSNGTRSSMVRVETGAEYRITATLSGSQLNPIATFGPIQAALVVDGTTVSTFTVTSQFPNQLETKSVDVRLGAGSHSVGVAFLNDACCSPADRNLFADRIEIVGPTNNTTYTDLFSRGNIYWNVSATDGVLSTTRSSQSHVIVFPDLLPPESPKVIYPEENAELVSARPSFVWTPVADAVTYRVALVDLDNGGTAIPIADTDHTSLVLPGGVADLLRGGQYSFAVRAVDASNNQSFNPTPSVFTIGDRVRYTWEASTTPTFTAESQLFRADNLTDTFIDASQPSEPLYSRKVEAEGSNTAISSHCGASGGFVNLCGNNHEVGLRVDLGGAPATYNFNVRMYATESTVGFSEVEIRVDGSAVRSNQQVRAPREAPAVRSYALPLSPGPHIVSVRFTNDQCCAAGDRNVFVDYLELTGPAGVQSIDQKLRIGTVYWRTDAKDRVALTRPATNAFRIDFPDETPPVSPIPVYPEDSAVILSTSPGFRWTPIADAANYRVVVIDEATSLQVVAATVPGATPSYDPGPAFRLERGLRYRWYVEAVDAAGNRSPDPAQRFFNVDTRLNYEIQIATSIDFGPASQLKAFPLGEVTRKQIRTTDLPQAGLAYYRVVATDGAENASISSPPHALALPDTQPPKMVRMLYPADGVQVLGTLPGFVWQEQEPDLDYEFEIATTSAFTSDSILFHSRAKGSFVRLPQTAPLQTNNVYFWRVRAIDAVGNAGIYTTPARISLRERLRSTYTLEVSTQAFHLGGTPTYVATTSSTACDITTRTCSLQLPATQPLQQNTTYYWRVTTTKTVDSEPQIVRRRTSQSSSDPIAGEAMRLTVGQFIPEAGGVIGNYFRDREFRRANGLRLDTQIDFPRLADGNPYGDFGGLTGTNGDSFSVRWTGLVFAPKAGTYKFIGVADDNQQLVVNGNRLFAVTQFLGPQRREGTITLNEGWHFFSYEMVENTGSAFAQLSYRCDNCSPAVAEQVIPSNYLAVPRSNTDRRPPVVRAMYLSSAMPSTATTPGRATLRIELNESSAVSIAINDDGVLSTAASARVGVSHDIPLGNVRGNFTYQATVKDLNDNQTVTPVAQACAPLESDLTRNEIRATYFTGTDLAGRVLDELQATVDYSAPSAAALPLVGFDEYSMRWQGGLFISTSATERGNNKFDITADDGHRFAVDGIVRINDFVRRGTAATKSVTINLDPGWHEIDLAYLQGTGAARARIARTNSGDFKQEPLATSTLASISQSYLRPRFTSTPSMVTIEAQSPAGTVPTLTPLAAVDCRDPAPVVTSSAPTLFPFGTTNVAWTARNRFNEVQTLVQPVRVVDTTPPTILQINNQVVPCSSPDSDGRTPAERVTLPTPQATDNADAAPLVSLVTPQAYVLDQPTDVTVIARDFSGNEARQTFQVTATDVGPLSLAVASEVTASRADNCTLSTGQPGTLVRLPIPTVTNLCLASSPVAYTHTLPAPATGDEADPQICMPTGTTRVRWTGRLGSRIGGADVQVRVLNTSFNVVVDEAPQGFINGNATVRMHLECRQGENNCFAVFDAGGVRRIQWRVSGTSQPSTTSIGDTGTYVATFTAETRQCPMNIVVIDAVGRQGVTQEPCFAIDRTPPSVAPGDLPVRWVRENDFTVAVDAVEADQTTWPHAFLGEDIPLSLGATDNDGAVPSGIRSVVATMQDVTAGTAPVEVFRAAPSPANDGLGSGPAGVLELCSSTLCTAGKLDMAKLGVGLWKMQITSSDVAGNTAVESRYLRVLDLFGGLDALYKKRTPSPDTGWLASSNFNAVITDSDSREAARDARDGVNRARGVVLEVPAQALLALRGASSDLSRTSQAFFLRGYIARAAAAEVRRLAELHAAVSLPDWNLYGTSGRYLNFRYGGYSGRQHVARPATIFGAVNARLDASGVQLTAGRPSEAIIEAADAFDDLSLLVDDRVVAEYYGREPNYLVEPNPPVDSLGMTERLFANAYATTQDSDYGILLATVVQNQIDRALDGGDVPVSMRFDAEVTPVVPCVADEDCGAVNVCRIVGNNTEGTCFKPGAFRRVSQRVATFREGIEALDCYVDPACEGTKLASNKEFLEKIYLSVQDSFGDLAAVQNKAFATHTWRQGIGLALTYVLNFTVYTGEAPLVALAPVDPVTIETECWWARMAEALDGGEKAGVDAALALFQEGRCLNVEIYNKFYGGGQRGIDEDVCVDPADYGCPTDGVVHARGGCLRVAESALPTIASMCGPLSP